MSMSENRNHIKSIRPSYVFHRCPYCGSAKFTSLPGDNLSCNECHWDSLDAYADIQARAIVRQRANKAALN